MYAKTGSTSTPPPPVLGDQQRRHNVVRQQQQHRSPKNGDDESAAIDVDHHRLEHKCRRERTRRNKMKSSIMRLKDILRDSVAMNDQQYAKLENADILELVLHQLKTANGCSTTDRTVATTVTTATAEPPAFGHHDGLHVTKQFQSGINLCAAETLQFLRQFGSPAETASDALAVVKHSAALSHAQVPKMLEKRTIPIETISEELNTVDNGVLDLRVNFSAVKTDGSPTLDSNPVAEQHIRIEKQPLQQQQHEQHHSPARRDVLDKIRRKIFERRAVLRANVVRNHRHRRPLAEQAVAEHRDDGYDSDEAMCMWRPW